MRQAFAAELADRRNLTIVTNNLSIPAVLSSDAVRDVYVLGGQYRPESPVTIGEVRFAPVSGISVIPRGSVSAASPRMRASRPRCSWRRS
jgi:DeoR/GlpR family transcriptional regulator of sugar metabolism